MVVRRWSTRRLTRGDPDAVGERPRPISPSDMEDEVGVCAAVT